MNAPLSRRDSVLGTAAEPLVRFEKVSKTYDGQSLVVRDLDLDPARMRMINNPIDLDAIAAMKDEPLGGLPNRVLIPFASRNEPASTDVAVCLP